MLTIVTGTPGAGKTLHMLSRIRKEEIDGREKGTPVRPIYVHGVPDLDYQYFHAKQLENPDRWWELPEGSVIVFDEAQTVFPQRPASKQVPEKCQQFSTHRHKGFDVWITTQDATNIDAFIRRMCGRHIHVHRVLNREIATIYEYDHYESKPTDYHAKKSAISVGSWKYPKKLFDRYKSATMHTYKARTPFKLYLLGAVAILVVGAFFKLFASFNDKINGTEAEEMAEVVNGSPDFNPLPNQPGQISENLSKLVFQDYASAFKPRVPGILHTAPAYSELVEPQTFPRPYCIVYEMHRNGASLRRDACKCFTQQVTTYETSDALCRYWVEHGFFDVTMDYGRDRERERGGSRAKPDHARTSN